MQYIVISDLHIGVENSLAIFHAQKSLADFLRVIGDEPTTLVINGDFVDFLAVISPEAPQEFARFDRTTAQKKVAAIIAAPDNHNFLWPGFRAFLAHNTANRIDVLLGNHDVELVFDEVQTALQSVMASSGEAERVRFRCSAVSLPGLEVGGVSIRLEHGFQYDPYNWYELSDLLNATQNGQNGADFVLPYGSSFVYDVLNELTPKHPFLPLLKPEPGVFWIMLALNPEDTRQLTAGGAGMQVDSLVKRLRMWLGDIKTQYTTLEVDRFAGRDAAGDQLMNAPGLRRQKGLWGNIRDFLADAPSATAAAKRQGQLALLRSRLEKLRADRDAFFDFANAQGDDFQRGYDDMIEQGYQVAVLGHSHARKLKWLNTPDETARLLYVNTGTWADLLDFDITQLQTDGALERWLQQLDAKQFTPTRIFTFARLTERAGGRGALVSLENWDGQRANLVQPPEIVEQL